MKRDHEKRVALYARVSTDGQTVENQLRELRAVAKSHPEWKIVSTFEDRGISGTKGRDKRPGFDAVWKSAIRKEVDLVAVWHLDRLGRTMRDGVNFLDDLQAKGIDLYVHKMAIDTTTPSGRLFYHVATAFAEWERALLVERVKAGLKRARAEGKTLGRPRVSADIEAKVIALRGKGEGMRKIARTLGIGNCTVQRIVNA